jgi:hypothetical protein
MFSQDTLNLTMKEIMNHKDFNQEIDHNILLSHFRSKLKQGSHSLKSILLIPLLTSYGECEGVLQIGQFECHGAFPLHQELIFKDIG